MLWIQHQSNRYRLHAGIRGGQEGFYRKDPEPVAIREASLGDNRLVAIEHLGQDGTTLVLQCDYHEVSTFVHGTRVSLDALPAMLAPLSITDSRDGIVIRARRGSGASVEYTLGANVIPEVGTVTLKPLETATVQIPHSGGKTVPGGQLWRDDLLTADGTIAQRTVLLANESTAAFVTAFDPADDGLASLAGSVNFRLS
ncbi:hypothetical protein ACIBTV_05495 [Micromonospora sp. NPDC049366]|uniref:hypothetical protein n=1 Tax=Micromonospora sp. NPDC049366 TaxID=3364271 RepID=UPI00379A162F